MIGRQICLMAGVMALVLFLCSSPALPGERFSDNGDGTVTDHQTGLMWSKTDNQGDIPWKEALQWVKYTFPFTIGTQYDDWRLPTLEELKSLYAKENEGYDTDCGQNVKIVPDIRLTCGWVWSSEKKAITAGVFNFNRGYHYTDRMVHQKAYRALAVRSVK